MRNSKAIQEEVIDCSKRWHKFEKIADLCEIENMQDNIAGLLGSEMPLYLREEGKEEDDATENIAENLDVVESILLEGLQE